jgi:hypothetical protein
MQWYAAAVASVLVALITVGTAFGQDSKSAAPAEQSVKSAAPAEQSVIVPLVLAIITGVIIAIVTQGFASWLQFRRGLKEKLVAWYAELIGIIVKDAYRAKLLGAFVTGNRALAGDAPHAQVFIEANENQRLDYRQELARLAMQIQILEVDEGILKLVGSITELQPILAVFTRSDPEYPRKLEAFGNAIDKYESTAAQLAALVKHRYARAKRTRQR